MTQGYFNKGRWIQRLPDRIPDITPCPCNSDCSTICVGNDNGYYWITCLGCFRESELKTRNVYTAVDEWNEEIKNETRKRL
jgi:transcription elongation factor Elf1